MHFLLSSFSNAFQENVQHRRNPSVAFLVLPMGVSAALMASPVRKMAIAYAWSVYAGRPLKEKKKSKLQQSKEKVELKEW